MTDNFEDHCWKDIVSQEILDIYKAYKRKTYIGPKPALLAIDLYNLAYAGGSRPVHEIIKEYPSSCGTYAWNAIEPTKELFAIARSQKIPVIYTTSETRREAKPQTVHATHRRKKAVDKSAYEIRADFKPLSEDVIIYKQRASGFFGTPLISHLTQLGIDSLIVCGESTSRVAITWLVGPLARSCRTSISRALSGSINWDCSTWGFVEAVSFGSVSGKAASNR